MKKRSPKFSVKSYLASLQKPIHICDKKALKAQAAAITARAIGNAQKGLYDPFNFGSVTKAELDAFHAFIERPRGDAAILRAHAATAVADIICDLQNRHRRSKG
jgi:hypothetical protein